MLLLAILAAINLFTLLSFGKKTDSYLTEKVWLPRKSQQHDIARHLDKQTSRIDDLIAEKELLIERLDELRWSKAADVLLLRPPKDSVKTRLKYLVDGCVNGFWGDEPSGDDLDIAVIRVADFDRLNRSVRADTPTMRSIEVTKRRGRLLQKGDLLIEKSGGGPNQPVGNVVIFNHDLPAVCSNFIGKMSVSAGHDADYVCLLFQALYALGRNVAHIKQTSGIQNLDADSYLSMSVMVPQLSNQESTARTLIEEFSRMEEVKNLARAAIESLGEYRDSLMHASVTGKVEVDAYMEAA